jgi:dTDP-4-dehydrorhamnose reductase
MDQFDRIFDIPYGTYHLGSHNEQSRYDVVCLILKELGLGHRIDELIERDEEKYAGNPRDARLDTSKIRRHGFRFSDTRDAVRKCIQEYSLKLG